MAMYCLFPCCAPWHHATSLTKPLKRGTALQALVQIDMCNTMQPLRWLLLPLCRSSWLHACLCPFPTLLPGNILSAHSTHYLAEFVASLCGWFFVWPCDMGLPGSLPGCKILTMHWGASESSAHLRLTADICGSMLHGAP